MVERNDQQPLPDDVLQNATEVYTDEGPQLLADILPGVIEEIKNISTNPVLSTSRNLTDLQRRQAQGDYHVSDADIAAAKADVEDALLKQRRPPEDTRP
jgi:hypothetical protein